MPATELPDRYAVFGNPIQHSKSPVIHTLFARQTGQNIEYTRQLVDAGAFSEAADRFFAGGGKGLNITVPFKLDAFRYAGEVTERARTAGAVNTLIAREDGSKLGDNTDGVGLVRDIVQNLGWIIEKRRVLVLGAGGAVRGVLLPLLQQQPMEIVVANRTVEKAVELAQSFRQYGNIRGCGFADLGSESFDLIINGTSSGLQGELPPLPATLFNQEGKAYDMVYADQPTVFMRWSRDNGASDAADGLGMLVGQAAESFFLWRGVRPEIQPVLQVLRAP